MNQRDYKKDYDRDGFIVAKSFLSGDELALLTDNIDRYIREVAPTLPSESAFYHDAQRPETLKQLPHMGSDPFFEQCTRHPAWNALAEQLVGEPTVAKEPQWFNKPPGTEHPTPPHQDNYYFCLDPPNVITLWLALDHVDRDNGCIRYLPGSHLRGIKDHDPTKVLGFSQGIVGYGPEEESKEIATVMAPGDLVAHHGNTIHRAEANRSATRHRRAFAMVFQGVSCRRDEEAYARYQARLAIQHQEMKLS